MNTTCGHHPLFGASIGRNYNDDILRFLILFFIPPDSIDRRYVDQHHFRPAPTVITKRTAITSNVHGSSSVSSNQSITTNTSTKISDTVISSSGFTANIWLKSLRRKSKNIINNCSPNRNKIVTRS